MSTYKPDGGPAFARAASQDPAEYHQPEFYPAHDGMTLRDYFAAKAMQGIMADSETVGSWKEIAQRAYSIADALIAERDK